MRRKRVDRTAGIVPARLLPGSELGRFDPVEWRRQRDAWARQHKWPPGKIGFLAFFRETVKLHSDAKGEDSPKL